MDNNCNTEGILYRALNPDEFRIVILDPGHAPDAIKCHIEYIEFESTAKSKDYEALSYEWGDCPPNRLILIDGRECNIRENLWRALCHLRLKDKPRRLWVDTLCINQGDVMELGHQIRFMDCIYRDAKNVAIWVGCEEGYDCRALELINCVNEEKAKVPDFVGKYQDSVSGGPCSSCANNTWWNLHRQKWEEISIFCNRNYWKRLWIIQEVTLATEATVYFGNASLPWKQIARVTLAASSIHCSADRVYDNARRYIRESPLGTVLHSKLKNEQLVAKEPLVDLVIRHGSCNCRKIQDKVFGLLSLACVCCRDAMVVDYDQSLYKMCLSLLNHHLTHHDLQNILEVILAIWDMFLEDERLYKKNKFEWFGSGFVVVRAMDTVFRIESAKPVITFSSGWSNSTTSLDHLESRYPKPNLRDFEPQVHESCYLTGTKHLTFCLEIRTNSAKHEVQLIAKTTPNPALANVRPFPAYPSLARSGLKSLARAIRLAFDCINTSDINLTKTLSLTDDGRIEFEEICLRKGDYICQVENISDLFARTKKTSNQFVEEVKETIVLKGTVFSLEHKDPIGEMAYWGWVAPKRFHFHPSIAALFIARRRVENDLSLRLKKGFM